MKIGTKIATGVVVGGLLGLFLYIYRQSVLLSSVCYDFITMTYEGVQNGIVTIGTTLKFTNYADYPITIKGYKIDVLVDNVVVGNLEESINERIPARGVSQISFKTKGDFNNALAVGFQTIIEQLVDSTSSVVQLKGTASITTGLVSINDYPIEYSTTTSDLLQSVRIEGEKCKEIT